MTIATTEIQVETQVATSKPAPLVSTEVQIATQVATSKPAPLVVTDVQVETQVATFRIELSQTEVQVETQIVTRNIELSQTTVFLGGGSGGGSGGNADTATKLATPRTIAGVSFDGTVDIDIPHANLTSIPATATRWPAWSEVTGKPGLGELAVDNTWTGENSFSQGVSGDYLGASSGYGEYGGSIWGISSAYNGSGLGASYDPAGSYGISWLRANHTDANSSIGEGLYVYTAGVLQGGIGYAGAYFAVGAYFATDVKVSHGVSGVYSGGSSYGGSIWGLDIAYNGSGLGASYSPARSYGISWLRSGHTNANSSIGEGLYVYQGGNLKGGIGRDGAYFATDVKVGGTLSLPGTTSQYVRGDGSLGSVEAWTAPTLLNSWVNYGGGYNPVGYYKDPMGVVHLRGRIKDGSASMAAFTLPVGYRPANTESQGGISVDASGNTKASGSPASLDGITFRAA